MRSFWSDDEIDALRRCMESGMSVAEIMERGILPGRNENAIRGKARGLKLASPRRTGEVNWQALEEALRVRRI